mmetsp:Transcript_113824/g.368342  ORF Transcript_113824/g.368342 Transcript_113824/m.368342 type:complete len:325 (+) Transcript_113824:622-1596(+)
MYCLCKQRVLPRTVRLHKPTHVHVTDLFRGFFTPHVRLSTPSSHRPSLEGIIFRVSRAEQRLISDMVRQVVLRLVSDLLRQAVVVGGPTAVLMNITGKDAEEHLEVVIVHVWRKRHQCEECWYCTGQRICEQREEQDKPCGVHPSTLCVKHPAVHIQKCAGEEVGDQEQDDLQDAEHEHLSVVAPMYALDNALCVGIGGRRREKSRLLAGFIERQGPGHWNVQSGGHHRSNPRCRELRYLVALTAKRATLGEVAARRSFGTFTTEPGLRSCLLEGHCTLLGRIDAAGADAVAHAPVLPNREALHGGEDRASKQNAHRRAMDEGD